MSIKSTKAVQGTSAQPCNFLFFFYGGEMDRNTVNYEKCSLPNDCNVFVMAVLSLIVVNGYSTWSPLSIRAQCYINLLKQAAAAALCCMWAEIIVCVCCWCVSLLRLPVCVWVYFDFSLYNPISNRFGALHNMHIRTESDDAQNAEIPYLAQRQHIKCWNQEMTVFSLRLRSQQHVSSL